MADTTHNVTIKATLDTSSISGSGSSGGYASSSNPASTIAAGAQVAASSQQIAAASSITQAMIQLKTIITGFSAVISQLSLQTRILHGGFLLLQRNISELALSIAGVNDSYLKAVENGKIAASSFAEYGDILLQMSDLNQGIVEDMLEEGAAIENATEATKDEAKAKKENAQATRDQTKAAKDSSNTLKNLIAGLGISQVGSSAERLLESTGNKGLSRGVGAISTIGTMTAGGAALG